MTSTTFVSRTIIFATFISIIFANQGERAYNIYDDVTECTSTNAIDDKYACHRWKQSAETNGQRNIICSDVKLADDKDGIKCGPSYIKANGYYTYLSYKPTSDNKLRVFVDYHGPSQKELLNQAMFGLFILVLLCVCACNTSSDSNDSNFIHSMALANMMSDSNSNQDGFGGWDVHEKDD